MIIVNKSNCKFKKEKRETIVFIVMLSITLVQKFENLNYFDANFFLLIKTKKAKGKPNCKTPELFLKTFTLLHFFQVPEDVIIKS